MMMISSHAYAHTRPLTHTYTRARKGGLRPYLPNGTFSTVIVELAWVRPIAFHVFDVGWVHSPFPLSARALPVRKALRVVIEPMVARGVTGGLLQLDDGAIYRFYGAMSL